MQKSALEIVKNAYSDHPAHVQSIIWAIVFRLYILL